MSAVLGYSLLPRILLWGHTTLIHEMDTFTLATSRSTLTSRFSPKKATICLGATNL